MLTNYGVDAIDVAPSKYFPDFASAQSAEIERVRRWWKDRGIEIVGMQSLLFGTQGLNLFGEPSVCNRMLEHLGHVCRIAHILGARYLVFGSPSNRDCSGLDAQTVLDRACEFFRRLGDIAADYNTVICLEPNPPEYGANFMTDSQSTSAIVRAVKHKAIRLQLDVGALTMNGENTRDVLERDHMMVAHIHASEPQLKVLGDCGTEHGPSAAAIRQLCPDRIVAIEMREDKHTPMASVDRALDFATKWYGSAVE
jgi:sugar phosphate isomerase/epimerase